MQDVDYWLYKYMINNRYADKRGDVTCQPTLSPHSVRLRKIDIRLICSQTRRQYNYTIITVYNKQTRASYTNG